MEGMCSGGARNEGNKMRLVVVECEICWRSYQVISDHAGVYICAACHRDIASPHHIHD
ncbi:MAG: hypothetical protein VST70_04575 [Nitrospirota bacterium]|nr:hypothetical protein [Nitrospirota bacterium]